MDIAHKHTDQMVTDVAKLESLGVLKVWFQTEKPENQIEKN